MCGVSGKFRDNSQDANYALEVIAPLQPVTVSLTVGGKAVKAAKAVFWPPPPAMRCARRLLLVKIQGAVT